MTASRPSPCSSDTLWVREPEHIEALASPLRQRIVDRLEAIGPCSVRELAQSLGRRADSLYYHLRILEEIRIIEEVESPGEPEVHYDLAHRSWHIAYEPEDPDNAAALRKVTQAMLRQANRDFEAGLDSPRARVAGSERNLWSLRLEASLTRAEQRALTEHLQAIVELLRRPRRRPGGCLTALTWVMAPIAPIEGSD